MNETDRGRLEALLNDFRAGYEIEDDVSRVNIICREGMLNIEGYMMFYTVFTFDEQGKFIEMGAYE